MGQLSSGAPWVILRRPGHSPYTLYYAPTPSTGFVPAANLTPQHAQHFMPLIFYTLLALVQEFLPPILAHGNGAILTFAWGDVTRRTYDTLMAEQLDAAARTLGSGKLTELLTGSDTWTIS